MSTQTQSSPLVRTVLHMSPALSVAALVAAQKRNLNVREWLDRAVADACEKGEQSTGTALLPWNEASASLFCTVASNAPEALHGRWRLLYEHVRCDSALWDYPTCTVGEVEDGATDTSPRINVDRLRAAWPRLVAAAFCC